MAVLVRVGNTRPEEWRVRCFAANCADDIRGDEYSEVTYSTQRAMAGDKSKHVVGLSRVCVEGIIKHNYA